MITGGAGFIGHHLQEKLRRLNINNYVYDIAIDEKDSVLDRDRLTHIVKEFKPTCIVHLSGVLGTHELWESADQAIDINIKGALNVGCAALGHCRMVSIEQPHIWYNVYEASKFAARRMLTGLAFDKNLDVVFIIAHNAFGEHQGYGDGHPQKIIPTFALNAWRGDPLPIWGTGKQKLNLIYAGQIADILFEAATDPVKYNSPTQEYHAAGQSLWTVQETAQYVIDFVKTNGGPAGRMNYLSMRRGEQPKFPYPHPESGMPELYLSDLDKTINWYRQHA